MTKVISLSEEAYKALKSVKRKNESFSDVVIRLVNMAKGRPLTEFAGKWTGDDVEQVLQEIISDRENVSGRKILM